MNETTCTQRSSKPPSIALAAGLLPTSAIQAAPADHVSEQRPIGAFRAIELSGPYHVMFKAQGKPALTLSGEPKQRADIETVVSGDRNIRQFDAEVHGSGDLEAAGLAVRNASVRSRGPGSVQLATVTGTRSTPICAARANCRPRWPPGACC